MVAGDIGMARQLTLQQRIFIVEQWFKHDKNPTATAASCIIWNLCLLLLKLSKATYGHPSIFGTLSAPSFP